MAARISAGSGRPVSSAMVAVCGSSSLISAREENRDLVMMGAYRAGSDRTLDRALHHSDAIDAFLTQRRGNAVEMSESLEHLIALTRQTQAIDTPING